MPSLPKNLPFFIITSSASYFAELTTEGKTKKLQSLTKIDFPLIADGKILEDKLEEALEKLSQKTLYLILSDDIFLHHIGDFPLKAPQPLEEQISHTVATAFPNQNESLHIVTLSLAKTSKTQTIQITAMSRANLHTLSRACLKAGVTIKTIMPASFAVKGFVSIDPSLFVLEADDNLWLTSHYIGVEHAEVVPGKEADRLTHAVTQLKTQKPHLQHIYICANSTETDKFTEALKDVLPSQLVEVKGVEAEADCPMMIKVLTVGFKDVVENKFPFPTFALEEKPDKAENAPAVVPVEVKTEPKTEPETKTESEPEIKTDVKPVVATVSAVTAPAISSPKIATPTSAPSAGITPPSKPLGVAPGAVTPPTSASIIKPTVSPITPPTGDKPSITPTTSTAPVTPVTTKPVSTKKSWGKYVLLAAGIALIIGLIGGGIIVSQGALTTQTGNTPEASQTPSTPEPEQQTSPTPSPTPNSSPVAKDSVSILILNATGVAGKAGGTASTFKTAGYTKVQTGNATETYDKGTFIMIKDEKNSGLAEQMAKDTKLTLKTMDYSDEEDSKGTYDVIVVLAE